MRTKFDIYVFINGILASTVGLMLAFVDDVYVLLIDELLGLERIRRTTSVFIGAPFNPDASFIIPQTGYSYIIRG